MRRRLEDDGADAWRSKIHDVRLAEGESLEGGDLGVGG